MQLKGEGIDGSNEIDVQGTGKGSPNRGKYEDEDFEFQDIFPHGLCSYLVFPDSLQGQSEGGITNPAGQVVAQQNEEKGKNEIGDVGVEANSENIRPKDAVYAQGTFGEGLPVKE